jgi:hypothetical protein
LQLFCVQESGLLILHEATLKQALQTAGLLEVSSALQPSEVPQAVGQLQQATRAEATDVQASLSATQAGLAGKRAELALLGQRLKQVRTDSLRNWLA